MSERELVNLLSTQRERMAALEAENKALREFVVAVDQTALSACECIGRWEWDSLAVTRHVLADEFRLPLPEVGR